MPWLQIYVNVCTWIVTCWKQKIYIYIYQKTSWIKRVHLRIISGCRSTCTRARNKNKKCFIHTTLLLANKSCQAFAISTFSFRVHCFTGWPYWKIPARHHTFAYRMEFTSGSPKCNRGSLGASSTAVSRSSCTQHPVPTLTARGWSVQRTVYVVKWLTHAQCTCQLHQERGTHMITSHHLQTWSRNGRVPLPNHLKKIVTPICHGICRLHLSWLSSFMLRDCEALFCSMSAMAMATWHYSYDTANEKLRFLDAATVLTLPMFFT